MSTVISGASYTTALPPPASSYYLWEAASTFVSVRLNLDVIDRLGADITNTFTDLTGPGSEIGGVLLGQTTNGDKRTFFVEDYELIECDYSDGPLFSLSDKSKSRMVEQLLRLKTSPRHSVLGFFRSHTRKNLSLSEPDLALIRDYFAGPETVFLLIKPFAAKPSRAGFFIWEDGGIRTEASYCQFPFKRAELVVRIPEAIVGGDFDKADLVVTPAAIPAPPSGVCELPQKTGPVSLKPIKDRPSEATTPAARRGRTNANVQRSLDVIVRQITRDPTEKKLFSAGMDLEREQERWSRFALESSHVSRRNNKTDLDATTVEFGAKEEPAWPSAPAKQPQTLADIDKGNPAHTEDRPKPDYYGPIAGVVNAGLSWRRWAWAALLALFVLAGGVVGARMARSKTNEAAVNDALDLRLGRDAGGLVLRWNRESRVIATAKNAILRIEDSNHNQNFDLNLEQLRFGKVVYFPGSENVNFRLEVVDSGGSRSVTEWVRVTGRLVTWPPQDPPGADEKKNFSNRKLTTDTVPNRRRKSA